MFPSHFSTLTDEELAAVHLAGESAAFQVLVERYASALCNYARRFTTNREDAEDIAQESFLRLYQHLPKLKLDEPLKPWLYKVCTNLCRNLAKRKKSLLFSDLQKEDEEGAPIVERIQDAEPTPAQKAAGKSAHQEVRDAIQRLPKKYQAVLTLYYWDELSYEEISYVLSIPVNTVRTHLRRGREYLERTLQFFL